MAKFAVKTPADWSTKADAVVQFGDGLVGPAGGVIEIMPEVEI